MEATQQNAALVEQAAAAAQSLQDQAAHLADVVAEFKLEDKAATPGRAYCQSGGQAQRQRNAASARC